MKRRNKFLICFGIGVLVSFLIMVSKNIFNQTDKVEIYRILVDSFFAPGIIMVCLGLLFFVSNEGIFDMFSYGMSLFFNLFRKDINKRKYKTYYDYKQSKADKPKIENVTFLLSGLLITCISFVFLFLYYKVQ